MEVGTVVGMADQRAAVTEVGVKAVEAMKAVKAAVEAVKAGMAGTVAALGRTCSICA